MYPESLLGI